MHFEHIKRNAFWQRNTNNMYEAHGTSRCINIAFCFCMHVLIVDPNHPPGFRSNDPLILVCYFCNDLYIYLYMYNDAIKLFNHQVVNRTLHIASSSSPFKMWLTKWNYAMQHKIAKCSFIFASTLKHTYHIQIRIQIQRHEITHVPNRK